MTYGTAAAFAIGGLVAAGVLVVAVKSSPRGKGPSKGPPGELKESSEARLAKLREKLEDIKTKHFTVIDNDTYKAKDVKREELEKIQKEIQKINEENGEIETLEKGNFQTVIDGNRAIYFNIKYAIDKALEEKK